MSVDPRGEPLVPAEPDCSLLVESFLWVRGWALQGWMWQTDPCLTPTEPPCHEAFSWFVGGPCAGAG